MQTFINTLTKIGKPFTILPSILEDTAQEQFLNVMSQPYVTSGALMPDAHTGYEMPIGAVCSTKDVIVPQFVGFDQGCGMCAYKTEFTKSQFTEELKLEIHKNISNNIPLGFNHHSEKQSYESDLPLTDFGRKVLNETGLYQLGTLGGGNHFIEIGYSDNDDSVWIIVHSGSRGMGAKIADYYIKKAYHLSIGNINPTYDSCYLENKEEIDKLCLEYQNSDKFKGFRENNPMGFKEAVEKYKVKLINEKLSLILKKMNEPSDKLKGIFPLSVNTELGKDYITDMNFSLDFALMNRKRIIEAAYNEITKSLNVKSQFNTENEENFINRNHNHAYYNESTKEWIHRKGATHAELGMRGVIPGNMRDGSFIVIGKGCKETLCSSSHGAGRIKSRKAAKKEIDLDTFKKQMKDIVGTINVHTVDESPDAYKDIFKVMEEQSNSVTVIDHIKVLINVKDDTPDLY